MASVCCGHHRFLEDLDVFQDGSFDLFLGDEVVDMDEFVVRRTDEAFRAAGVVAVAFGGQARKNVPRLEFRERSSGQGAHVLQVLHGRAGGRDTVCRRREHRACEACANILETRPRCNIPSLVLTVPTRLSVPVVLANDGVFLERTVLQG